MNAAVVSIPVDHVLNRPERIAARHIVSVNIVRQAPTPDQPDQVLARVVIVPTAGIAIKSEVMSLDAAEKLEREIADKILFSVTRGV